MSKAQETRNAKAETQTAVSLACAVMLKPFQAQAKAEKALDRARSSTWAAVQEAAACFPDTMTPADRTALSGELARQYAKFYGTEDSAKVAASQHAKAIHAIATKARQGETGPVVDPSAHASMKAYFEALKAPRTQADAGNAPKNTPADDADDVPGIDAAAVEAAATRPTSAFDTSGLSVELGSAFVRLMDAARKNPDLETALCMAANAPQTLIAYVEWTIQQRTAATAARLGEKFGADKVKAAA